MQNHDEKVWRLRIPYLFAMLQSFFCGRRLTHSSHCLIFLFGHEIEQAELLHGLEVAIPQLRGIVDTLFTHNHYVMQGILWECACNETDERQIQTYLAS